MRSYLWTFGLVIVGSVILGVMMAQEFSIMLYAMLFMGSILLGILAART